MIVVHFEGRIKNRKKVEAFAYDVINDLFPREFPKRDIDIGIKFRTVCDGGVMGYAEVTEDDSFLVEIARNFDCDGLRYETTERDCANTLAHELVHVKQYIRKELSAGLTRWKGQEVPHGPRGGILIPYMQQPWEKEAFLLGEEYAQHFWD